ncbi:MAG: hypothetical protein J6Y32_00010 [Bacteroidales bacterium]|nr:hypothetical protein [Bacteroidales bacterium]
MKKTILTLLAVLALASTAAPVAFAGNKKVEEPKRNDQFGLFNHVAIGVDLISPDGFGLSVGTSVFPWMQIRAGYAIVPWSLTKWPANIPEAGAQAGQPIAFDVNWEGRNIHLEAGAFCMRHTGNLMIDFFPARNSSFHLTAGVIGGSTNILTLRNTAPLNDYEGVGFSFYPGGNTAMTNLHRIAITNGNIGFTLGRAWAVRPYLGLGWGSFVPSKRVGVMFDMGVEYNGGIGLYANAKDIHGTMKNIKLDGPGLVNLIENMTDKPADEGVKKAADIYDTVSKIPVSFYLKLALVVKIF